MDKNADITIRKVGNGWMVIPDGLDRQNLMIPTSDIQVFQHLDLDQVGVQQSDYTLFGFLTKHYV